MAKIGIKKETNCQRCGCTQHRMLCPTCKLRCCEACLTEWQLTRDRRVDICWYCHTEQTNLAGLGLASDQYGMWNYWPNNDKDEWDRERERGRKRLLKVAKQQLIDRRKERVAKQEAEKDRLYWEARDARRYAAKLRRERNPLRTFELGPLSPEIMQLRINRVQQKKWRKKASTFPSGEKEASVTCSS